MQNNFLKATYFEIDLMFRKSVSTYVCQPVGSALQDAAAAHYEDPGSLGVAEIPVQFLSHSDRT